MQFYNENVSSQIVSFLTFSVRSIDFFLQPFLILKLCISIRRQEWLYLVMFVAPNKCTVKGFIRNSSSYWSLETISSATTKVIVLLLKPDTVPNVFLILSINLTPHLEPNIRNIDKLQSNKFMNLVWLQIFRVKSSCFLWVTDLFNDAVEILNLSNWKVSKQVENEE